MRFYLDPYASLFRSVDHRQPSGNLKINQVFQLVLYLQEARRGNRIERTFELPVVGPLEYVSLLLDVQELGRKLVRDARSHTAVVGRIAFHQFENLVANSGVGRFELFVNGPKGRRLTGV